MNSLEALNNITDQALCDTKSSDLEIIINDWHKQVKTSLIALENIRAVVLDELMQEGDKIPTIGGILGITFGGNRK